MTTVSELMEQSGSVVHLDDDTTTLAAVAESGRRLAAAWSRDGLEPGDRLAVWAPNGLPYLLAIAAAAAGRFVLVSVNTRYAEAEAVAIITRSGCRLVVTDQTGTPVPSSIRVLDTDQVVALAAASPGDPLPAPASVAPDDPFVVFTTSGTTSRPKLVLHEQRSIAVHAGGIPARFGYGHDSRVLVALPLCGVFGFDSFLGAVAADSEIWLPSRFDAADAGALIERVGITALNGSDDMFHRLLETGNDLSSVEVAGYGRFNTSLDGIVERADRVGLRLTGLYGMSEVQALFSLRNPDGTIDERQLAGGTLTSSLAEARVVDPESGTELPSGTEGELVVRGPSLFAGYLAEGGASVDGELTRAAHLDLDGEPWFRTGDLARIDGERTFTYLTRIGDVLRLGGFLVSPSEIEEAVMAVPGVAAAQVVAVDRPSGSRPVAFVILDTATPPDLSRLEDDVKTTCAARLAKFKVPIRVLVVAEFPTTPSANGTKIQRNKLRDQATAALRAAP